MSSKPSGRSIVDTVVLLYFLLCRQSALLADILGAPLAVPRIVYDPDEEQSATPSAMSEITRSIDHHARIAGDGTRSPQQREQAASDVDALAHVHELHRSGALEVIDLSEDERTLFGALTSPERSEEFDIRFPLQAGEAACVAIAASRGWVLVTDDGDALTAARSMGKSHPYERVRKLLIRAAASGLITEAGANDVHAQMVEVGFWDSQPPFA